MTPASDSVRNLPHPILSYRGHDKRFCPPALYQPRGPVRVVVGLEGGNQAQGNQVAGVLQIHTLQQAERPLADRQHIIDTLWQNGFTRIFPSLNSLSHTFTFFPHFATARFRLILPRYGRVCCDINAACRWAATFTRIVRRLFVEASKPAGILFYPPDICPHDFKSMFLQQTGTDR